MPLTYAYNTVRWFSVGGGRTEREQAERAGGQTGISTRPRSLEVGRWGRAQPAGCGRYATGRSGGGATRSSVVADHTSDGKSEARTLAHHRCGGAGRHGGAGRWKPAAPHRREDSGGGHGGSIAACGTSKWGQGEGPGSLPHATPLFNLS